MAAGLFVTHRYAASCIFSSVIIVRTDGFFVGSCMRRTVGLFDGLRVGLLVLRINGFNDGFFDGLVVRLVGL